MVSQMKKRWEFSLLLLLMLAAVVYAADITPATRRLIPRPEKVENLDSFIDGRTVTWYVGANTNVFPLAEYYSQFGGELVLADGKVPNAYFGTVEDLSTTPALASVLGEVPEDPEGYYLEVTDERIVIIGRTDVGAFYGVQTLRQLTENNCLIVGAKIVDYPKIRYRAIMDDVSRGPIPKLETMKQIVKTMSEFKLNMYSPYMEMQVLDGIQDESKTLTAEDYRELVEYAKQYHVEVVPSLQTFGHCNGFLFLPEYAHLGNLPSGSSQLDPTNPEVYEFLEAQIAKWAELTDSQFINIGGDETWEITSGNSGMLVQQIGVEQVYLDHVLKVMEMVKNHGKTPLFWGDMALAHPEIIENLPNDAIVLNWHYGGADSMPQRLEAFRSKGKTQWAAPGIDNWLRIFPFYTSSNSNVMNFAKIGFEYGIEGLFTTMWDDDGDTLFGHNWYGLIFASEAAWKAGGLGTSSINQRFDMAVFGEDLGIASIISALANTNYQTYYGYFNSSNLMFFKNPFADKEFYNLAGSANQLLLVEQRVLETLSNANPVRNGHILKTLGFAARRNGAFGRKILLAKEVIDTVTEIEGTENTEVLRELAQKLFDFEIELRELYAEFEELYLEENKEYFLKELKQRYFTLRAYIFTLASELENASYMRVVPSPEALGLPRATSR